jgi:cardiolipin synthase A/B
LRRGSLGNGRRWRFLTLLAPSASFAAANTHLLITEVYYDTNLSGEPEEYVAISNPTTGSVSIAGWQLSNGTYTRAFPSSTALAAGQTINVTKTATRFQEQLGFQANFEYGGNSDATVPDMVNTTTTAPTWANAGDVVQLKDPKGFEVDRVSWSNYLLNWSSNAAPTSGKQETPGTRGMGATRPAGFLRRRATWGSGFLTQVSL